MSVFLRIDINIAAMILLGVVFFIAYRNLDRKDMLNKKFLNTSLIILIEIFFETITCIINRYPIMWLIPISDFMHICLYITAPILTYYWYVFIYSWVMPNCTISFKKSIPLLIPIAVNFIITMLSPIYGFVFFIDNLNVYHRGQLFILSIGITYFYLFCSLMLILKQRKKIMKQEFVPLFIFGVFPTIGGIVQTFFYGALLMWSSSAFSLVIAYIYLQQRTLHLDRLTGAWTRESFDYYISQRVKFKGDDKFGVIFIDLDGLKQINDEYGHLEGDCAIKTTVQLIKGSLRETDVVARMGGDEFVIILDCESRDAMEKAIDRINASLVQYNKKSGKKYKLDFSFGADILNLNNTSIEQFFRHIDELMYNNKKKKHQLNI